MGNPILDMSNKVDDAYLEKFKLKSNDQILAAEDGSHLPIYKDLDGMAGTKFIPGGATQNSMRVAQWCLRTEKKDDPKAFRSYTSYMGCVGKDDYAKKMLDASKDLGVTTHYMEDASTATGTCAVLVNGDKGARSLIANLAAANNYKDTHLEKPENWALVQK